MTAPLLCAGFDYAERAQIAYRKDLVGARIYVKFSVKENGLPFIFSILKWDMNLLKS
jgi:hypothetical protein